MTDLATRQQTAVRNLDDFISRLQYLSPEEWHLQTPDTGWEVRHLAAHLVGTVSYMTVMLNKVVAPDDGGNDPQPEPVTADSATADIIANLIVARNHLATAIEKMTEEDLARLADTPNQMFAPTGDLYLTMAVFETGIHRYDLEFAIDPEQATLDAPTTSAIDDMYGGNLALMTGMAPANPDAPLGYHLSGSQVQHHLTWDGKKWGNEPVDNVPVATIQGSDIALALFMTGRIPVTDPRLRIEGDHTIAGRFKSYVPGP